MAWECQVWELMAVQQEEEVATAPMGRALLVVWEAVVDMVGSMEVTEVSFFFSFLIECKLFI